VNSTQRVLAVFESFVSLVALTRWLYDAFVNDLNRAGSFRIFLDETQDEVLHPFFRILGEMISPIFSRVFEKWVLFEPVRQIVARLRCAGEPILAVFAAAVAFRQCSLRTQRQRPVNSL
jgi:hypothetical protein